VDRQRFEQLVAGLHRPACALRALSDRVIAAWTRPPMGAAFRESGQDPLRCAVAAEAHISNQLWPGALQDYAVEEMGGLETGPQAWIDDTGGLARSSDSDDYGAHVRPSGGMGGPPRPPMWPIVNACVSRGRDRARAPTGAARRSARPGGTGFGSRRAAPR
jgi:hypothetical protein